MSQRTRAPLRYLGWTAIFALIYCQAPLYYSNQNQYFLHGLAAGGFGYLSQDWLAQTADATPTFSALVAATYRWLHPGAFYIYYALLQGAYLLSLSGLVAYLAGKELTPRSLFAFQVLFVLVHSALVRWASYHLFQLDYPWYLQSGVAGQYVLGAMFQPSTFGVLLLLSLWCFVRERPYLAVTMACAAAVLHATYLLSAALLTLGYMLVLWQHGRLRPALQLGSLALLLVAPVLVYTMLTFRPTTPEVFAQAQHILVHERIPHHCLPHLWCDWIAVGQIGWMLASLVLVRRTVLFPMLGLTFAVSAVLTLLQVATNSDMLALLFPWRTSAFLMPVATAVVLGRLVQLGRPALDRPSIAWLGRAALAGLATAGVLLMTFRQGFNNSPEEAGLLEFVRATKQPGDVYLIPVRIPNLTASTRGSLSSDFKPAAAKKSDARLIPIDLQRFRLATGAPVYVDFKSVPYRDLEVLEWHNRLECSQRWYEAAAAGMSPKIRNEVRQAGITHIVTTAQHALERPGVRVEFADEYYRVERLSR